MKYLLRPLPVAALLLGSALPFLGQQSSTSVEIPGFLNPRTGAFRPNLVHPSPDAAPKLTTYDGTLEFNFTINVQSKIPSGS
jgi:hypothetical protein